MTGIYKITNKIDGKVYIGQSIRIEQRLNNHKQKALNNETSSLYDEIRNFGIENFDFELLEECITEKLNEREIFWISHYQSTNPKYGYNKQKGGQGSLINEEKVFKIIELLVNTTKSRQEIANECDIGVTAITEICQGHSWKQSELTYPLRNGELFSTKIQHFCIDCNALISKQYNRCHSCAVKLQRICERPTRENLKQEIRTISFLALGKKYHVADNTIRDWCKNYHLPRTKKEINSYSDEEWNEI